MSPLISVVIPFYNPGARLALAVESVRANGYENLEIILVDDGSSERTEEIPGLRILRQRNQGPAAARNAGWRHAQGDFLAFLDADDLWEPGSLGLLMKVLSANDKVAISQGKIQRIYLEGPTNERRVTSLKPYYGVNLGSCLFRRRCLEELEGFDESLRHGEDSDFFVKAWHHGVQKVRLEDIILYYMLHHTNTTLDGPTDGNMLIKLVYRHFRRNRGGGKSRREAGLIDYLGWEGETRPREA